MDPKWALCYTFFWLVELGSVFLCNWNASCVGDGESCCVNQDVLMETSFRLHTSGLNQHRLHLFLYADQELHVLMSYFWSSQSQSSSTCLARLIHPNSDWPALKTEQLNNTSHPDSDKHALLLWRWFSPKSLHPHSVEVINRNIVPWLYKIRPCLLILSTWFNT